MSTKPFIALAICLFFVACSEKPSNKTPEMSKNDTIIVGNDLDEHGCKGSAGYTWSVVKNECIQIFNSGIRLNPKAAHLDTTLSAFVVFKSTDDDAQAELFLPTQKKSIILAKNPKEEAGLWANDSLTITQWKGMYSLEDKKKTLLYQGATVQ